MQQWIIGIVPYFWEGKGPGGETLIHDSGGITDGVSLSRGAEGTALGRGRAASPPDTKAKESVGTEAL